MKSQIHKFIQRSAIQEVFNEEMEQEMALEYLSISQEYVGDLMENTKVAKDYCSLGNKYSFENKRVSDFFPLIRRYVTVWNSKEDFETGLIKYLQTQTSLDEFNIMKVVLQWQKLH